MGTAGSLQSKSCVMSSKLNTILYYATTGLISLGILGGAMQYLTMNERIVAAFSYEMDGEFNAIGFPAWLIYPMAIAKILGIAALWAPVPRWIREWAYAGLFFNLLLAVGAHAFNPINPEDQDAFAAAIMLVILCASRFFLYKKEGTLKAVQA